jgi:selenide,water dikinase
MDTTASAPLRLTQFSHGGGCGCKIAPAMLREIVTRSAPGLLPPDLLVGIETADDAAVYRINDAQAIVATTDFFTPIVDDPFDFGAIAATNALSDVYAMGGTPLFALAVVGMPVDRLSLETIRRILQGGESICSKAGIPVAGGHTIDSVEPIYGLVAIGLVDPSRIRRNSGAQPGDALILGKPLGIGIYSAAIKKQRLSAEAYAAMLSIATQLNTPGAILGGMDAVHAMTDVTGFGLIGHLLAMCRGSTVGASIDVASVPLLPETLALARAGVVTGASARNWASSLQEATLDPDVDDVDRAVLTDPQTSGGLLVACAPAAVESVLDVFAQDGFDRARVIGAIVGGDARIVVKRSHRQFVHLGECA